MSLAPSGINRSDPFVADRLETVAKRLALLDLLDSEGIEAAVAASEDEWRSPPQPTEPDPALSTYRENRCHLLQGISHSALARLVQGALLNMQTQRDIDLSGEVTRIKCPVLIIHGDSDTTVPMAFGRALTERILHAKLSVLNGHGHGLIVDPAAQQVIVHWLRSG